MIRINIIGTGFLDIEEGGSLGFKKDNQQFRFCEIGLGRSVEFSVPDTQRNRGLLGFSDDPAQSGEIMRRSVPCQVIHDGGAFNGTLNVTGFEGNSFKCAVIIGNATWINDLQSLKVSDMATSWDKGIIWSSNSWISADDPSLFVLVGGIGLKILPYENGLSSMPNWSYLPSINIKALIKDLLDVRGIPNDIQLPHDYWLVASSLKGSSMETITMASTGTHNLTISQGHQFFDVVDIVIEWATGVAFNQLIGGGSTLAKGFKAKENIQLTFPSSFPTDCFLVQYSSKLKKCYTLGGVTSNGMMDDHGDGTGSLDGRTVELKKGYTYFFAPNRWLNTFYQPDGWLGYQDTYNPFSFVFNVVVDDDIAYGDPWYIAYNMPDCTFFELLKSAALAAGMELFVDDSGVAIKQGAYGVGVKALENVISVDAVTRRVDGWGNNTRNVEIAFDSEEYVQQPIEWNYPVDNDQTTDDKTIKTKFSEGNVGTNGVEILDVEYDAGNNTYKLKAKKPTIVFADGTTPTLQRIPDVEMVACGDIGSESTSLRVKVRTDEGEFFALKETDVLLWRGMAYVWSAADWANGVMSLTLQKVSQPTPAIPLPPATLVSIHASFNQGGALVIGTDSLDDLKQYLTVTAYYDDSSSRVLADGEYTLSGTLAYPSATITVDCQGETDTFAVAVAYDAQVEYVVSNGTQIIDTLIEPHRDIVVNIKWRNYPSTQNSKWLLASGSSNTDGIRAYIGNPGNWRFGAGVLSVTANNTIERVATIDKNGVVINGTSYNYNNSPGNFSSNVTIKLLGGASGTPSISARLFYCQIEENGILARDYVSVRIGTAGYLYDRVSGTLFGSGDLDVGADV